MDYTFNTSTQALPVLFNAVLGADEVGSRDGLTRELTHIGITLTEPWKRELLLPERKHNLAAQIAETMWVLAGRDDVAWLANYLPRASQFSDDGMVWRGAYGPRLRRWHGQVDQLEHIVNLLRASADTRQAVAVIYDPLLDTFPGKDIPCNDVLQFIQRSGKLDLHVFIRSNDAMWGWSGINAFEWSALQEIVAGLLGFEVGSLHFSVTSFHLYERHWEKAHSIIRTGAAGGVFAGSPRFDGVKAGYNLKEFYELVGDWFTLESFIRQSDTDMTAAINDFPEPMLQSWLRVIAWWWGDATALAPLEGTRLAASARLAVQPKLRIESVFLTHVNALHADKHAAYGDSWKRRGEMLGIMANIARKIDRLGATTADETSTDTAVDLLVYLGKYRVWLTDQGGAPLHVNLDWPSHEFMSDHVEPVSALLQEIEKRGPGTVDRLILERVLTDNFTKLEELVVAGAPNRYEMVDQMLVHAYLLARGLWQQ